MDIVLFRNFLLPHNIGMKLENFGIENVTDRLDLITAELFTCVMLSQM